MDCRRFYNIQSIMKLVVILLVLLPLASYSKTLKTNSLIIPSNLFIYDHQSFDHIDNLISNYNKKTIRDTSELRKEISQLRNWINKYEQDNERCTITIELLIFSLLITVVYIIHIYSFNKRMKRSSKELQEKNSLLNEQNVMKNNFISIISHDLRSPFDHIIGLTELILDNSINYEESKKYIKILNTNAKNTLILLDNLLNWAKSQTGQLSYKPEKLLLSNVIKEIIALNILHADNKSISINYSPSEKIIVFADENMLRTVLRNLISNAIKFTNINGAINILTTLSENFAEVTISDNGIGISEEKRKVLFEIISNSTSLGTANENGSGLGLVLCKEFVHKNKGEIVVESKEGKGSTFKFTLPLNPTE